MDHGAVPGTTTDKEKDSPATAVDEEGVLVEFVSAKEVIHKFESKRSECETKEDFSEINSGEKNHLIDCVI